MRPASSEMTLKLHHQYSEGAIAEPNGSVMGKKSQHCHQVCRAALGGVALHYIISRSCAEKPSHESGFL